MVCRNKYLRLIEMNRKGINSRSVVYVDEMWVNQRNSFEQCWTSADGSIGPKVKTGRGGWFIIVHAGRSHGFLPGALLMFRSPNGSKGEYLASVNCDRFKPWFVEQLLPNIDEKSLIVMGNASYHSRKISKSTNEQQQEECDNGVVASKQHKM